MAGARHTPPFPDVPLIGRRVRHPLSLEMPRRDRVHRDRVEFQSVQEGCLAAAVVAEEEDAVVFDAEEPFCDC
jgi:hypothetical protein